MSPRNSKTKQRAATHSTQGQRTFPKSIVLGEVRNGRCQKHEIKRNVSKKGALMLNGPVTDKKGSHSRSKAAYHLKAGTINFHVGERNPQSEESMAIRIIRQFQSNAVKYDTSSMSTTSSPMELSGSESSHPTSFSSLVNYDSDNDGMNTYSGSKRTVSTVQRIKESLELCRLHRKGALSHLETCKCYYAPVYGKDIYGIIQCLQRQEIPALTLNQHDLHRVDMGDSHNDDGYRTGTGGVINQLLQLLDCIVQSSKDVATDAENIHRILSNAGNSDVHELLSKLSHCTTKAISTTADISKLQNLFHQISTVSNGNAPPYNRGDKTEIDRALLYLNKSRDIYQSLYRNLCDLCDTHSTHDLYFNLDVSCERREAKYDFEFRFAFQRAGNERTDLIWMRSCPSHRVRQSPVNRVPRPNRNQYLLCPEQLDKNERFSIKIGEGLLLERMRTNKPERSGLQLSSLLKRFLEQSSRLRLARLVSETVLRLDLTIWNHQSLESHNIMVISPSKYGGVESLESRIQVCLKRQDYTRDISQPWNQTNARAILTTLGWTLLELGLSRLIQRPNPETYKEVVDDLVGKVKERIGEQYAGAVWYCLVDCPIDGSLYEKHVSTAFYNRVVKALKTQEDEDNEAKSEANEGIAEAIRPSQRIFR